MTQKMVGSKKPKKEKRVIKKVNQFSIKGKLIKEWDNVSCLINHFKIPKGTIYNHLNGHNKNPIQNYFFRYKE